MDKAEMIQEILNGWMNEYGLDGCTIRFEGWYNMDETNPRKWIYGMCYYGLYHTKTCRIRLGDRFEGRRLGWREKSALWHEFCHAYAFLEDGESDGHNMHWRELRRKKPVYLLGDWALKFTYPLM